MKMSYSSNYFKVITVLATLMFYYVSCSNSTENSSTTTENTNVAKTNATQNVIWPGDADNNGVVSTEDILSIGLKYNKRGKERAANQRNTRFEKYTSTPWGERLPNEADISHIDCDGNGIIDNADMSAIAANFTNTVPTATTNDSFKPQGTIGMLLKKVSSTRYSCEEKGKICYKNIYNMDLLKEENIYGANFILNYQARIGVGITIKSVKITNSCLGTEGDDFISITDYDKENQNIYFGLTRITPDKDTPPCKSLGAITMEIEEVVVDEDQDLTFKLNTEAETVNIASFINGDVITFSNIKVVNQ